ncbi:MAG: NAD(P)-dependent oxidoreductase [Acidobacteriota bacterium]|nr:NAD(P)-dependent oxidoreductase [Acidobacteriota bacterium]
MTSLGWIGAGRMGQALASRLLSNGLELAVYNRTREKAMALVEQGATLVDHPADLADRDLVFTMVAGPADVEQVVEALLSKPGVQPGLIIDSTTISPSSGERIRARAQARGTAMLAAPVSGNPKVAAAGRLTIAASGPAAAWDQARPYLELLCRKATYVGEGESARLVKVCHNLMLGVVAECMAEISVLAEQGGVSRGDLWEFMNDSVMGSTFTRYKTPAYVNLDFEPTFTPALLLKDFHLGLDAARESRVSMPVVAAAEQAVQLLEGIKGNEVDFAALLELVAAGAGLTLASEQRELDDGLSPLESIAR